MTDEPYDRVSEDLGNIVNLGHLNIPIPDQGLATLFYVSGLGLTRDPIMRTGVDNMWINVGDSQFHLPTGSAGVAPGLLTGLVLPDLSALRRRLDRVAPQLAGTKFEVHEIDGAVEVRCPWGNRIRCHEANDEAYDPRGLGIAYVAFDIPRGRAAAIAAFYHDVLRAVTAVQSSDGASSVRVSVGNRQWLIFQEREAPAALCPAAHIQIYIADFSGPHRDLKRLGVELEESSPHQYRFKTICEKDSAEPVFILDHEVRSMTHPMYNRPLVNRNPAQGSAYVAGRDFYAPEMNGSSSRPASRT